MEARKYKMIEKLLKVQEEDMLYKLESVLDGELVKASWDELQPEVKQVLDASLGQSEKGEMKPHDEVMQNIRKKHNIA